MMSEIKIHPLKKARKKIRITQEVLADLATLSVPTIKRAEAGKPLDAYSISAICNYFTGRYGRQVEPQELGLYSSWESKEHLRDDDSIIESEADENEENGDNLPTEPEEKIDVSIAPLPAKQELLRQLETRDWSVWAGLKLIQIMNLINSYSSQIRPQEEICEEIQTLLDQEIKTLDDMKPQDNSKEAYLISRQQALIMIAVLPSNLQTMPNLSANNTFLPQCAASITACWHLLRGKGLAAVEEILPTYVPTLITIALRSSPYQAAAARLATLANMLRAIVAKHRLKDAERERYSHEAVRCSQFSGDRRIQAAALMTLGYTYLFCVPFRPKKAVETLQAALRALDLEDSLLRSDIYIALADAHAQCKEEKEALECIALAQKYFPLYPEYDPSFLYADCSLPVLHQWEGKMYLHLAEHYSAKEYYENAWNAFEEAAKIHQLHDRGTSEIIIDQADVARGMGELTTYTNYLRKGIQSAVTLRSQRRYNEAYAIYQQTPEKWLAEGEIRSLARDIFGGELPGKKR